MNAQNNDGSTRNILVQGNPSKAASLVYWTLLLLALLSLGVFLLGILLAFIGSVRNEPAPATWTIVGAGAFLCLAFAAAMRLMEKMMASKTVFPLSPVQNGLFILAGEGVYLGQMFNVFTRARWYTLYPWGVLSMDSVDEKGGFILLKKGRTVLRLDSSGKNAPGHENFGRMVEIVRSRVSVEVPAEAKARRGYKWIRVIVIFCLLFFVHLAGTVFFDSQTKGEPGDGACDLCGATLGFRDRDPMTSWSYSHPIGFEKDGKLTREFCGSHGTVYCILHPSASISLLKSTVSEAKQGDENVARSLAEVGFPIFIPLFIWAVALFITIFSGFPKASQKGYRQ
jgi:hypothetical protein